MKILFIGKNAGQGTNSLNDASLLKVALEEGHIQVYDLDEFPDFVICSDWKGGLSDRIVVRKARALGIPTVLIVNEPSVVIPQGAQSRIRALFDRVLEVGRPGSIPLLLWPQSWNFPAEPSQRKDLVVMVNSCKWSFMEGQMYWLRNTLASTDARVHVFGNYWERHSLKRLAHLVFELFRESVSGSKISPKHLSVSLSRPLNNFGPVLLKLETMAQYKVALVIENSRELMTEKLFDAFFAGCVPVYVGPNPADFGIPDGLAFQASPHAVSVSVCIEKALAIDYERWRREVANFLTNPKVFDQWDSSSAFSRILEAATKT